MQPKTLKIIFWVLLGILAAFNLFSGYIEIFPMEPTAESAAMLALLGYPMYFYTMLGVAKILGTIAMLQTKYKTIKEWAYAGFTIDYISAALSFWLAGGAIAFAIFPLVCQAWLFGVYFLWKKVEQN